MRMAVRFQVTGNRKKFVMGTGIWKCGLDFDKKIMKYEVGMIEF